MFGQILSKERSLRKAGTIKQVFRQGKKATAKHLNIWAQPQMSIPSKTSWAIVVSKKVSKKAAIRNLIKRRVREILRIHQHELEDGFNLVIKVNTFESAPPSYRDMEQDIMGLIKKLRIIKG